jgi:hypothetical protein
VLRPGDRVHFDGEDHQVVGPAGASVRLRSDAGAEQVILAGHLMASPSFAVVDAGAAPTGGRILPASGGRRSVGCDRRPPPLRRWDV